MAKRNDMSVKSATRILRCTCSHVFQDRKYGKGKRLHNIKVGNTKGYACTVCSNVKFT